MIPRHLFVLALLLVLGTACGGGRERAPGTTDGPCDPCYTETEICQLCPYPAVGQDTPSAWQAAADCLAEVDRNGAYSCWYECGGGTITSSTARIGEWLLTEQIYREDRADGRGLPIACGRR